MGDTKATDVPLIGVFLGDVQHFLNDVLPAKISLESLKWLLRVARDGSNSREAFIVDGSQNPSDKSWTEEDEELLTSTTMPSDFVFIAHPKNQADYQRLDKLLKPLESLQFHTGDSLKVFHWTSDKRPVSGWPFVYANVIPAYLKVLQNEAPWLFLEWNQFIGNDTIHRAPTNEPFCPVGAVRIIPAFPGDDGHLYVFLVQPPGSKSQNWSTIGGTVRLGDTSIEAAALREWKEEIFSFSGLEVLERSSDALQWVVLKANSWEWKNWNNCWPPGDDHKLAGYSASAWTFVLAKESFFHDTCRSHVNLMSPEIDVVRPGQKEKFPLIHTKGLPYVEQERGAWFQVNLFTGQVSSWFPDAACRADLVWNLLSQSTALRERLKETSSLWRGATASKLPEMNYPVRVGVEGVHGDIKRKIYQEEMQHMSPEASTQRLVERVSKAFLSDDFHEQFYAEEIQVLLQKRADPNATGGLPDRVSSVLMAVLANTTLNGSIAQRSARSLCTHLKKKGCQLTATEMELMQERATRLSEQAHLREKWQELLGEMHSTSAPKAYPGKGGRWQHVSRGNHGTQSLWR